MATLDPVTKSNCLGCATVILSPISLSHWVKIKVISLKLIIYISSFHCLIFVKVTLKKKKYKNFALFFPDEKSLGSMEALIAA